MSASANIHTFIDEETINTLVRPQRQELLAKMGVMALFLVWSQTWFKWTKQAGCTGQPGTASTLHSLSSQNQSLNIHSILDTHTQKTQTILQPHRGNLCPHLDWSAAWSWHSAWRPGWRLAWGWAPGQWAWRAGEGPGRRPGGGPWECSGAGAAPQPAALAAADAGAAAPTVCSGQSPHPCPRCRWWGAAHCPLWPLGAGLRLWGGGAGAAPLTAHLLTLSRPNLSTEMLQYEIRISPFQGTKRVLQPG